MKPAIVPFWTWGKQGATPPAPKYPKNMRERGSFAVRTLRELAVKSVRKDLTNAI